jgi:hypothetical protein
MTALARQLQARNHDIVFLYSSGAAGLPFVPGPEKDYFNETRADLVAESLGVTEKTGKP